MMIIHTGFTSSGLKNMLPLHTYMCFLYGVVDFILLLWFISSQIIHLKRFQFFNGRWVKSQRIVRFPTSDLNPLRFTAQNGNQHRAENGTETSSSSDNNSRENPSLSDTRPEITDVDMGTQPLANRGGEIPVISKMSLNRREGVVYNLVAITVSLCTDWLLVARLTLSEHRHINAQF